MENIDIKMSEYEVLSSGSILALEDTPVEFQIRNLTFVFVFIKTEDENKEMVVNVRGESNVRARIEFINFDNELGCGLINPIAVGHIQNRELSLLVRFSQLNRGGKLIHYSWLLKGTPLMTAQTENNS